MIRQVATLVMTAATWAVGLQTAVVYAQPGMVRVAVPAGLEVPAGNVPYLKTHATGTQNYVCVPSGTGAAWKFLGPQATLFVGIPWVRGEANWQVATHFLSANPNEGGTARPTWQSSLDSSVVWGKAAASSSDPQYVAAGAIPWLLVAAAGWQRGPLGGAALLQTTFIHRVNTVGGVAPVDGCDASAYGQVALVPYETDYIFYQMDGRK